MKAKIMTCGFFFESNITIIKADVNYDFIVDSDYRVDLLQ